MIRTVRWFDMNTSTPEQVTQLLVAWSNGDNAALDKLMPLGYKAWLYREISRTHRDEA